MKKIFLVFMAIFGFANSHAQTNSFPTSGNVGIGTASPTLGKLQISGTADLLSLNSDGGVAQFNAYNNSDFRIIQRNNAIMTFWINTQERLRIDQSGNLGIGTISPLGKLHVSAGSIVVDDVNWYCSRSVAGVVAPILGSNGNTIYLGDLFGNLNSNLAFRTTGSNKMVLSSDGNLSIGTDNAQGYRLAVNGTAIATSVTVKANANWPDYVFKNDYQLPALIEVKSYIDKNQHLPDMPSQQEIIENGQNLGEMNKLLLKKVEELTLYLIEKDKNEKEQQKQINQLKEQMAKISIKVN